MPKSKKWISMILPGFFFSMSFLAALAAYQSHQEQAQAKRAILGTLICHKTAQDTWSGMAVISKPYALSHGTSLLQPETDTVPWKNITMRGSIQPPDAETASTFEHEGAFYRIESRNVFFLPMRAQAGTLKVEMTGLPHTIASSKLQLNVINNLCGCEKTIIYLWIALACFTAVVAIALSIPQKPAKTILALDQ